MKNNDLKQIATWWKLKQNFDDDDDDDENDDDDDDEDFQKIFFQLSQIRDWFQIKFFIQFFLRQGEMSLLRLERAELARTSQD